MLKSAGNIVQIIEKNETGEPGLYAVFDSGYSKSSYDTVKTTGGTVSCQ